VQQTYAPSVEINGPLQDLGLEMNPSGEIKVNPPFNETSVSGVFAGGDCATMMRAVPQATTGGMLAGVGAASQIQAEDFQAAGL
jgi:gliotoxin/aspirochlorine biosynthesis thioredoxin reductase